jgi:hypothetical protein
MAKKKAEAPLLEGFPIEAAGAEIRPLPPGIRVLLLPKLVRQAAESLRDVNREERDAAHDIFRNWIHRLVSGGIGKLTETQVEHEFYSGLMVALGYASVTNPTADQSWSLQPKWPIAGEGAVDAAIGRFGVDDSGKVAGEPTVLVEIKGAGTDLDAKGSRRESPVQQLWRYLNATESARWGIVSNYTEIRLYSREKTSKHVHRVMLTSLDDRQAFAEFWAVFSRVGLLGSGEVEPLAARLLRETSEEQEEVSDKLYAEYAERRVDLIRELRGKGVDDLDAAIAAAQKLLDRILFIAFAEDRGLIRNRRQLEQTAATRYPGITTWNAFQFLFRAIDTGDEGMGIPGYNGSLFKPDPILDDRGLALNESWANVFRAIGGYDFRDEVSVDVLGRIFERSITDIEAIRDEGLEQHEQALAAERRKRNGQRKRHGVYYTDAFITEYLVSAALDPAWEAARADRMATAGLAEEEEGDEPPAGALASYARGMLDWLDGLTVCDPACGSGAFLIAAYDWFEARRCELLDDLRRADPDAPECKGDREEWKARSADVILRRNLYGVDLSPESVEIARLSLWIRTARPGRRLTDLSDNVRVGNSVVEDSALDPRAFDWKAEFPAIVEGGGFDAVIGNPPYVRQERLGPFKDHFKGRFRAYHGMADLYVYFYELGANLLRPGGRLAYVVTNKWMKAGYGEPLRKFFAEQTWVESVVDFGHAKQFFKDADVFPCFLVVRKPDEEPRPETARVCIIPRETVRLDELSNQIISERIAVELDRFGSDSWSLEPIAVHDLLSKVQGAGQSLSQIANAQPLMGIKTGYNEAFLIDTPTRERILAEDPGSAALIRPYLRGQDIARWHPEWAGLWMIALKSSGDHPWPWADLGAEAEACFAKTYPGIYAHLKPFEPALIQRQDKGRFWWELRSCAYWDQFEKPKIIYQEIQFHPSYSFDSTGMLGNNKTFFIPVEARYLLGILNSPTMWWHNWRYLPHMKDEALSPVAYLVEKLPIPKLGKKLKDLICGHVDKLMDLSAESQESNRDLLDWLRVQYDIATPSTKLKNPIGLSSDDFVAEVQKLRGKSKGLTSVGLKGLREEYARTIEPARGRAAEALRLEERLHDLVNEAYGLTPEEVRLMWDTAPPRMPIPRPASTR